MIAPGTTKPSRQAPEVITTAADALVGALVDHGVDIVFLNPGTDTAPVQEAFARLTAIGYRVPRVVLCLHEAVALAAAHAYFAVTGRPQVVMVHVDVGTQNLGAMLHNASRAQAGVVIIAGLTPATAHGEQPGGRDTVVHWQQDVRDQPGIVRSYVKHTDELKVAATLTRQLARAFQVAAATPAGPVYLTVAREVLMQPLPKDGSPAVVGRRALPSPTAPDPEAVQRAARILARSEHPVITTARIGRSDRAVEQLVHLAELLGASVIDRRERMNFPSTHPCYIADPVRVQEALRAADAVLVVDCDVPWVPTRVAPPETATVIQLDPDPVKTSIPGWGFPVDLCLQADPYLGLRGLNEAIEALAETGDFQPRGCPERPRTVTAGTSQDDLAPAEVVATLDSLLQPQDIVVEEVVTNTDIMRAGLSRTLHGSIYQPGGSALGWALAGAVGVRLARPASRVVAVVGDGSFYFANPTAALWTALDAQAPILVVVLANGGYAASRRPVFELFPDGSSRANNDVVGTQFRSAPDIALLAQACHACGEHASTIDELKGSLARGFSALDQGRSTVVVAHVSSPWI